MYRRWAINKFPVQIKKTFKQKCKDQKIDMVEQLKKIVRVYVNETKESMNSMNFKNLSKPPPLPFYDETKDWAFSSFPIKLLADFKSCCAIRGDRMRDTIIYLVGEFNNG